MSGSSKASISASGSPRAGHQASWEDSLGAALQAANFPTLLMVLVHLTGDMKWLSERYQCARIRGVDENDSGGLPEDVRAELRGAAFEAICQWKRGKAPAIPEPSLELIKRMIHANVGEEVPGDTAAMIAAGIGLDKDFDLDQRGAFKVPQGFKVLIIGAGVSGLCTAIRLQGAGIPYQIIEKNETVGGTWWENRYPAAGVDTPSHLYSFSFVKHDWTMHFALRQEIQSYVEGVAERFGLLPHVRFKTEVKAARFDERRNLWVVTVRNPDGRTEDLEGDVLVGAVGLLNMPKMPKVPGMQTFKGPCFHTARWPEGVDVRGKRVAVIGNGASAMQIVPAIADQVKQVTVFQRSKQWAAPFHHFRKQIPEGARFLHREVPYYQPWYRQRLAWIFNDRIHFSLQVDPDWPHPERSINKYNDRHREFFTEYIKTELGERQDLLPHVLPDYPPFGKRMLLDNGWYRTMTKPNVRLVTGDIARITPEGIESAEGVRYEADIIVFATGFDTINMLSSLDLRGLGGQSIREAWSREGAQAHLGIVMPGFPNFFVLHGPNTALGHGGSAIVLIETQVRYMMGILQQALERQGKGFRLDVRRDVHDRYNTQIQEAHKKMIWTHKGMRNWYRNEQGRVVAAMPFRNDVFWRMARETRLDDYNLSGVEAGHG